MADGLLLWAALRQKDKDRSIDGQIEASSKRKEFLRAHLALHGSIRCAYCGKDGLVVPKEGQSATRQSATVDHFVPTCSGGKDSVENYVPCCRKCNRLKADTIPNELPMYATCDVLAFLEFTLNNLPHEARMMREWNMTKQSIT
jgi:5-methylcytosine-specific restriction endonuclease McrA